MSLIVETDGPVLVVTMERPQARNAVDPAQAHGRLIYLTEQTPDGYPPLGSMMREPARFTA